MRPYQKFSIIRKLDFSKKLLCKIAKVSRSGYYKWLETADEPDRDYEDYLLIKEVFKAGKSKLGWRGIRMGLDDKDITMNHKKIIRIMNKYELCAKIRTANPYKQIMKKGQDHRTFPNLLDRQFKQDTPYKILCTDITYLPFNGRYAYLSVVKDIATREVVAWKLSLSLTLPIVLNTIEYLKKLSNASLEDIIIHSDQGAHYTSPEYIRKVKELKMIQSMSRKGNCIDNAPIESFFGHMKDEIDTKTCKTFKELEQMITDYMKYYNNSRFQWNLKKMTPVLYRNHLLAMSR